MSGPTRPERPRTDSMSQSEAAPSFNEFAPLFVISVAANLAGRDVCRTVRVASGPVSGAKVVEQT